MAEPGVDEWHGTFPSEDAATAWAAIDRLAHDLVANSTCTNIEQARGKALTDLVTGNATIDVQIVLTVPADTQPASATDQTTVAASEPHAPPPANSQQLAPGSPEATFPASESHAPAPAMSPGCEHSTAPTAGVVTGAVAANTDEGALTTSELSSDHLAAGGADELGSDHQVVASGANEPGSDQPVLSADSAQDTSATAAQGLSTPAVHTDNLVAPENGSDDDLVQVQGSRPSEPLLVRRTWLRDHLRKQPPQLRRRARQAPPRFVPCDPLSGARLDPRDDLATNAYRPGPELAALVRARDGRCRFPGCCVAARFCDLDHVRPWPTGPTSATNLLTLCRRHHRIKQRPGWRLRLAPDGTATWTDPTGHVRTTAPLDALTPLVLAADPTAATAAATPAAPVARSVWSALEHHLTFRLEHLVHPMDVALRTHPTHRHCTSAVELRAGHARRKSRAQWPDEPPF